MDKGPDPNAVEAGVSQPVYVLPNNPNGAFSHSLLRRVALSQVFTHSVWSEVKVPCLLKNSPACQSNELPVRARADGNVRP